MPIPATGSVNITENLQQIHHKIEEICQQYQRDPADIQLLAVTKTKSVAQIKEAYDAGQRCFGENYLQEAMDKIQQLNTLDIEWHFIGSIQSNKTRDIAEHFHWVHSIDRAKVVQRLSQQRPPALPPLNILLQLNINHEETKSGIELEQLHQLAAQSNDLPGVTLRGLMAIPAPSDTLDSQRQSFRAMHRAFLDLQSHYPHIDTLSMGMSNDMTAAIAEGTTLLRIGTAIFGPRNT